MSNEDDSSINFEDYEILPEDFSQPDLNFKVIVIGNSGVGKSSITKKATKNIFEESYNATIGFEFLSFILKIKNTIIRLQIWDTCGQEVYRSLITNFYRNSSLAIIVYSIDNRESFENIDVWLKEMRKYSNPDTKVFLIGNKIDLEKERKINKEEGEMFSKNNNISLFLETSAKIGFNTEKIFIEACRLLYKDYLTHKKNKKNKKIVTFPIDNKKQLNNQGHEMKNSCCS
jgi:small GTP-binding protein